MKKRLAGAVLLALLLALGWAKAQAGVLPEMLWICHVATGLLALGLLFDWAACSAVGFLFHLAVGVPAYLLYLGRGGDTTGVSLLLHLLSPLLGWWAWRGQSLPRLTPALAVACYGLAAVLSFLFTPEAMNVNLSFRPWPPIAALGAWPSRICNAALMLGHLMVVQWLFNRPRAAATRLAT